MNPNHPVKLQLSFNKYPLMGRYLIYPVDLGDQFGMNYMIQDIYLPGMYAWEFDHRERSYSEPHQTKKDFKKCDICKKYKRKFNIVPLNEILIAAEKYK